MIQPRNAVRSLDAYSAPQEGRGDKVRLDFNENTTGFSCLPESLDPKLLTVYPEYNRFLEALSQSWDLPVDRLMLTNGSDEALFVTAFTFIEPGQDSAVLSIPTFPMIPHYLKLVQANMIEVPVTEDLEYDIPAIESALNTNPKFAIFASPDNPTGAQLSVDIIARWCRTYPQTLFVIDEAYAEYADESALPLTHEHPNLLVTRSFSKAWGLAGLRLGLVTGHPDLIRAMQCVRSPYSVNTLALMAAEQLLPAMDEVYAQAKATMALKDEVVLALYERGYRVKPGGGNFFLLQMGIEATAFCAFCEENDVLVRNRSSLPKMWGMIRVSVGTREEMDRFLACLDSFRKNRALIFDLDDTLVDTSQSYDATIADLILEFSGKPLESGELTALRAKGGFNDDWDATCALLRSRGITIDRATIEARGSELYLEKARVVETLLTEIAFLEELSRRYRLFVATGRPRCEYEPVWQDRLDRLFERVVCQDDEPNTPRKPAPDLLLCAMKSAGLEGGLYIGNAVDDMQAALAANLIPVGVTTTQPAEVLAQAGAYTVIDSLTELRKVLML